MTFILTNENNIGNHFIAELRNVMLQQDRMRFRKNLEHLGELFAYEISKTMLYENVEIETPLGIAQTRLLAEEPVLATIMRGGLPLSQGLLNFFDRSDCAFIAAYRKVKKSGNFEIHTEYVTSPNLEGRIVIVSDPILATGRSMVLVCKELLDNFAIKQLHVVTAIACKEGIEHVKAFLPNVRLWVGDVDDELTSKSYVVPGLGDAGDLAFGAKE